ncbi:MAG: FAD-dependent oxidoreductase, partial [Pseudomonadota bacterium]
IYPVKGYSITFDFNNKQQLPKHSLTFNDEKIVCTILNNKLRIAGLAEFDSINQQQKHCNNKNYLTKNHPAIKKLYQKSMELLPIIDPQNIENIRYWSCYRSFTPNSLPIIGKSIYSNFYINTGHSSLGWTLACGSANLISKIINEDAKQTNKSLYNINKDNSKMSMIENIYKKSGNNLIKKNKSIN